jgi:alpha-ketoglutaric semialdehyde dehydrogenase
MTAHQKNFIAGEWVDGTSITRDINPSNTKDVVGEYAKADKAQTEKAIAAAKAAFPAWARSTPQERFDALTKISVEILARKARRYPKASARWRVPGRSSHSSPVRRCG